MTEVLLAERTVSEPLEGLEKMKAGTSSVKLPARFDKKSKIS
jgi:hypothetical protein